MATQADMVMSIRGDVGALRQDMRKMEQTVDKTARGMRSAFDNVFKLANLATVGGSILALGKSIIDAVAAPIEQFIEFDDTMRMVGQRSQATAGDMMILRDTAMDLGRKTSFTAQEVAGAMRNMATAGFTPGEIDEMTGSILNLARATGTDLPEAAKVASVLMRQFSMDASDMGHITDVITHASNNSMLTVEKMGTAFAKFGPVASELGVSLEEAAAGAMLLANTGAEASTIGTGLRRVLTTSAAKVKELDALFGGESFADEQGRFKGLIGAFEIIDKQIAGLTDVEKAEKLNKAFSLLGITAATSMARGTEEMLAEYEKMREGVDGLAARGAAALDEGVGGGFRRMTSAWDGLKLSIVSAVEGPLADVFNFIAEKINEVTDKLPEWVNIIKMWRAKTVAYFEFVRDNWSELLDNVGVQMKMALTTAWVFVRDGMVTFFTQTLPELFMQIFAALRKEIERLSQAAPGAAMQGVGGLINMVPGGGMGLGMLMQEVGGVMPGAEPQEGKSLGQTIADILFADDIDLKKMQREAAEKRQALQDKLTKRQNVAVAAEFLKQQKEAALALKERLVARGKHLMDKLMKSRAEEEEKAKPTDPLTAPNQVHGFGGGAGAQLGTAAGYKALLSAIHAQRKNRLDTERNRILKEIAGQNKDLNENEAVMGAPGEG